MIDLIVIGGLTAAALLLAWLASRRTRKGVVAGNRRGRVVVLVHGWRRGNRFWAPFISLAQDDEDFKNTEFVRFRYRLGKFTRHSLSDVARTLQTELLPFKDRVEVCLAGFGVGALVVRATYLNILRDQPKGPVSAGLQVKRLVLFAPPNHGLGAHRKTFMLRLRRLAGGRPLHDAYAGSDFIVNLRLGWLTEQKNGRLTTEIAQMRAADDRYVSEEDTWDVHCTADRSHVVTGGHQQMARPRNRNDIRYVAMKDCILGENPQPRDGVDPDREPAVNDAKTVLFLVSGIRDWGFRWQGQARRIVEKKYQHVKIVPAQFDWFSTWDFLWHRDQRIRQWTDVYTRELSLSRARPGARMVVLAHSYGTYAVCHALRRYKDIRVDRLFLAGSVLDRKFPWPSLEGDPRKEDTGQIGVVWNACSTFDFWVGVVAAGLRRPFSDLGSAGFIGFTMPPRNFEQPKLPAGHGAFARKPNLESALDFLLGDVSKPSEVGPAPSPFLLPFSTRASIVFPLLVALVFASIAALAWWAAAFLLPAAALALALKVVDAEELRIILAAIYTLVGCYALLKYV
jgi:pimeloyl-ACP methyl ester carboxylesterase